MSKYKSALGSLIWTERISLTESLDGHLQFVTSEIEDNGYQQYLTVKCGIMMTRPANESDGFVRVIVFISVPLKWSEGISKLSRSKQAASGTFARKITIGFNLQMLNSSIAPF